MSATDQACSCGRRPGSRQQRNASPTPRPQGPRVPRVTSRQPIFLNVPAEPPGWSAGALARLDCYQRQLKSLPTGESARSRRAVAAQSPRKRRKQPESPEPGSDSGLSRTLLPYLRERLLVGCSRKSLSKATPRTRPCTITRERRKNHTGATTRRSPAGVTAGTFNNDQAPHTRTPLRGGGRI